MKKYTAIILTAIMVLTMSQAVFAAVGDVAGNIYSTDIKAYINGVEVDSYNIGGKTVVVVEDITDQYAYADNIRTLAIWDFAPEHLVGGSSSYNKKSGTPVGKIYETDIKTIFRGRELTCYSLNGKMAIEIEELGSDNEFSDLGGKYIWNETERTISLEMIYRYTSELHGILRGKSLNMVINESDGVLVAEFVPVAITGGSILGVGACPANSIMPVMYNGEVIGYQCKFPNLELFYVGGDEGFRLIEGHQASVDYYYVDKITEIISGVEPVKPTAQDWLTYYENNMYNIFQQFETDEYLFLYMWQPSTHGSSQFLVKLDKESGNKVAYSNEFPSVSLYGQRYFENVVIDEENEKVYLHYDVDYVIDLKTDTIEPIENGTSN